eukprot:m.141249 g.141249  ORF g.141249 m.141249 type:complete len:418 (-) comp20372_c0_seq2:466-1719(-)
MEEFQLAADSELRVETKPGSPLSLVMTQGRAEVFGAELVRDKVYTLQCAKIAVFTWHGCSIKLTGEYEVAYTSSDTPMVSYVNLHAHLHTLRDAARSHNTLGPRVMVVGPPDVGKTTLCRILLNYAVRLGDTPLLVDLDVREGVCLVPGTLNIAAVNNPIDLETEFSAFQPLSYHFGHQTPDGNKSTFEFLVGRMARNIAQRCESDENARHAGCVFNTSVISRDLIRLAQKEFEIDIIVVLDSERLYNELKKDMATATHRHDVVALRKSGGVVVRDDAFRTQMQNNLIHTYFYGTASDRLSPHSFTMRFESLKFFKIGAPQVPLSCLPIGEKAPNNELQAVKLEPGAELVHRLLSISDIDLEGPGTIDLKLLQASILGVVNIQQVDMESRTITLLSPAPHPLPKTVLVLSEVVFSDA